ncbi:MAG TPA: nuclear transport factor 2 family protein [Pyrinomonadaceae bacterium]|nr:nuclear transport factor 2 family protein [Pyrinomonadaceae bacterium]
MKTSLRAALALCALALLAGCSRQPAATNANGANAQGVAGGAQPANEVEQEIRKLDEAWHQAHIRRDADALRKLIPAEATFASGGALMTGDEYVKDFVEGETRFESVEVGGLRTRVFGDAAVATAVDTIKGRSREGAFDEQFRRTATYVRRDGRWQLVALHVSRVGEE